MSWFTVLRLLLYRSVLELFSKSFKVFHCSVIKVLCFVVISDNFYIISDVWSLVNNFFNLFFAFIAIRIDFCRASRVSLVIISCSPTIVNNKFHFFSIFFRSPKKTRIYRLLKNSLTEAGHSIIGNYILKNCKLRTH